jgi:hypothetical protein
MEETDIGTKTTGMETPRSATVTTIFGKTSGAMTIIIAISDSAN